MRATPRRVEIPDKLGFLLEPHRTKVAYGGRGSAKSWSFARVLLLKAASTRLRILCAREFQVSIADSVHKLLQEQIEALGMQAAFAIYKSSIRSSIGSEFIFTGIRSNPAKIKSLEGVDIAWVEEASKVSAESWRLLIPTIRKAGSEIWVSFNPDDERDPTYQRYVANPPPGACVVEVNWPDNPWFPDELRREKDYDYSIDPENADHIWKGKTRKLTNANVLRGRYVIEPFEPNPDWGGPYQGADWGFASDPTCLVRLWVDAISRTLYIEHEAYGVGVDLDDTPALFDRVPDSRKYKTRADSARPETISHMRHHWSDEIVAAEKGPGSVEDGVEHLRSYAKIVIHPRCKHAADEADLWSWKTDKLTGEILPELIDKHNHIWDASRYALEPLIKKGGGLLAIAEQELERRRKEKEKEAEEERRAGKPVPFRA